MVPIKRYNLSKYDQKMDNKTVLGQEHLSMSCKLPLAEENGPKLCRNV